MRLSKKLIATIFVVNFYTLYSYTLRFGLLSTLAETETTRVETTTISREGESITLPSTTTYILVDPISGTVRGKFEPSNETVDIQTITPGTVVIDQLTGQIAAAINPSGKIVSILTAPAYDPLLSSIDARRGELNRAITLALDNGSINSKQAEDLRARLDEIGTKEAEETRHGRQLHYSESLILASRLNNIGNDLVFLTHANPMEPLIGSRFVYTDGQVIMAIDDLDFRRMKLMQRVEDEYLAGRLMHRQVTALKGQLDSAATLETECQKNGEWTTVKKNAVAAQLDSVESTLNQEVASK